MDGNPQADRPEAPAPSGARVRGRKQPVNKPLQIAYQPLEALVPYAANARRHSPRQIEKLAVSLETFGWTFPMAVAAGDMIAGHGRLAAALKLRAEGRSVRFHADPTLGPTIDLSHLSKAERRAYILADNRLAEEATWDLDLLRGEVTGLQLEGVDITLSGFDLGEIDTVLNGWSPNLALIDRVAPAATDLLAFVRVRCTRQQLDALEAAIRATCNGFPGVEIDTAR